VGTHDAWAAAWGLDLGTPPCAHVVLGLLPKAHTWRFGHASVLGTPLCIYIWCLDCLPEGLTHPSTRGAWAHQDPIILRSRMLQHPN